MPLDAANALVKLAVMDTVTDDSLMVTGDGAPQFSDAGVEVVQLSRVVGKRTAMLITNLQQLIELAVVAIEARGHAVHSRGHFDQEPIDRPDVDAVAALCQRTAAFRLRHKDTEIAPNPQTVATGLASARGGP